MKKLIIMISLSLAVVACDKNEESIIIADLAGDWEQIDFVTTEAGKALGWGDGDIDYWEIELFEDRTLRDNFFIVSEKQMERGYGSYYIDGDILITTYDSGVVNGVSYGYDQKSQYYYRIASVDDDQMVLQFLGDNDEAHGDNNIADLDTAKATTDYLFTSTLKNRNDLEGDDDSVVGYWDFVEYVGDTPMYSEFAYRSNGEFTRYNESDGSMWRSEGTYDVDGDLLVTSTTRAIDNGEIVEFDTNERVTYNRILSVDKEAMELGLIGMNFVMGDYPYIEDLDAAKATTDYYLTTTFERE